MTPGKTTQSGEPFLQVGIANDIDKVLLDWVEAQPEDVRRQAQVAAGALTPQAQEAHAALVNKYQHAPQDTYNRLTEFAQLAATLGLGLTTYELVHQFLHSDESRQDTHYDASIGLEEGYYYVEVSD